MSAEVLREAARLMRERAEAVTAKDGPIEGWYAKTREDGRAWICDRTGNMLAAHGYPAHAEHIASWHPAVALAVANWLEMVLVAHPDPAAIDWRPGSEAWCALDTARAYLGSDQ